MDHCGYDLPPLRAVHAVAYDDPFLEAVVLSGVSGSSLSFLFFSHWKQKLASICKVASTYLSLFLSR